MDSARTGSEASFFGDLFEEPVSFRGARTASGPGVDIRPGANIDLWARVATLLAAAVSARLTSAPGLHSRRLQEKWGFISEGAVPVDAAVDAVVAPAEARSVDMHALADGLLALGALGVPIPSPGAGVPEERRSAAAAEIRRLMQVWFFFLSTHSPDLQLCFMRWFLRE